MKQHQATACNIFLVGVGGQGIVLASSILATLAFNKGLDVKQNEVHGLSQRGGSVTGIVRWGAKVFTPVIMEGEAHFLFAMEQLEALRWAHYVRPDGVIIADECKILPASVMAGGETYPKDISAQLAQFARVCLTPGAQIAKELGNSRIANMALIGALSRFLPEFEAKEWHAAIAAHVKEKYLAINLSAFQKGAKQV